MTFRFETEMFGPAERWLQSEGLRTRKEFATPWGVCDLVGVAFNKKNARRRLSQRQSKPIGKHARIALLRRIPDSDDDTFITLGRLEREFKDWFTPAELREEIGRLVSWNLVCSPRRNSFQKVNGWLPLHERIVALELKLHRIEEALAQAIANLKLTVESYVGLPASSANRVFNSSRRLEFKDKGIGLLAVHQNHCKVAIKPQAPCDAVDPNFEAHCVERFWKDWVTHNSA